jgi:hypothetical protein
MSRHLEQQLQSLRDELANNPPQNDAERASLHQLLVEIEQQLVSDPAGAPDASLVDGVNLAVERFEVEHPTLAATLRNIMQSLHSMGI